MHIKWECEREYNLKINGTVGSIPLEEVSNIELRKLGKRENTSYSNAILSVGYMTSQGWTSIQLQLQLIAHPPADIETKPHLHFQPVLDDNEISVNYFHLFWYSGRQTEFTILIYNLTHIIQHQTHSTSICLKDLTEGTKYKFCIIEASYACRSSSWNCIIKTIPILRKHFSISSFSLLAKNSSESQSISMRSRNLRINSWGSDWIQISWSPLSHISFWRVNDLPLAYLITAVSKSRSTNCYDRIYSIQAPWAHDFNSNLASS
ncbi:unnamed protein product [Heterobilharzia americana]|nr:unnamed protein product [Heterobilharzia americana]